MHKTVLAVLAFCAIAPSAATATVITGAGSLPGGNPIYLPDANYVGSGPVAVGGGVTWSSNQSNSVYGWTGGYTTNTLVVASGDPPIIGLNDAYDVGSGGYATMTLTFATPTAGFLAELFWNNGFSNANSANIAAYDSANNLLEYVLLNNNGNDTGTPSGYYGFSRAIADIAYVNFNNGYIGARNISYVGPTINDPAAVPEPSTWAMMIGGFGLLGMGFRRRKVVRSRLAQSA
jgi:hypothetical protein